MLTNIKPPFFSIIITGHGEANNLTRSFDSILNQFDFNNLYKDIQLIYVDDSSEGKQERLDLVHSYHSKIHIAEFTTEDYFDGIYSNPKQIGLQNAVGEWITFLDCTDALAETALDEVKSCVNESNTYLIQGNTNAYLNDATNFLRTIVPGSIMTDCTIYGKFFKLSFLRKHDIQFKNSYEFYEDTHFLSQINAASIRDESAYISIDKVIYHRIYSENPFPAMASINARSVVEKHLKEFMETAEPYFRMYKYIFDYRSKSLVYKIIQVLINVYLYHEYTVFKLGDYILSENLSYMHEFVHRICYKLEMDETAIIQFIYENPRLYIETRKEIVDLFGDFIESQSIRDFVLNI